MGVNVVGSWHMSEPRHLEMECGESETERGKSVVRESEEEEMCVRVCAR